MLSIAIPKGSLQEQTLLLFNEADLPVKRSSREYTVTIADERISGVKILRPQEIPKYVEDGYFDMGISGMDCITESGADVVEVADMPYAKTGTGLMKMVIAVPEDSSIRTAADIKPGSRVTTEFPNITKKYFDDLGIPVDVFYSFGATEAKVPEIMDVVVDLTETGSTLRRNNLKIIDVIMESTTRLIANKASWEDPARRKACLSIPIARRSTPPGISTHAPRYDDTLDARAYAWSRGRADQDDARAGPARPLVDSALQAWVAARDIVGVMGGHALERGRRTYAAAARLGRALAAPGSPRRPGAGRGRWRRPTSGRSARVPASVLDAALARRSRGAVVHPRHRCVGRRCLRGDRGPLTGRRVARHPDLALRARAAQPVRDRDREVLPQRHPRGRPARGLQRRHRVPARRRGTVQEVFQDACENYYADESVGGAHGAGRGGHWTEDRARLAAAASPRARSGHGAHVHLVDRSRRPSTRSPGDPSRYSTAASWPQAFTDLQSGA